MKRISLFIVCSALAMGLLAGMPGVAKADIVDLDFAVTGLSFTSIPTGVPQSVAGTVTVGSLDVNGSPYSGSVNGSLLFSGTTTSSPSTGVYNFSTASDGITLSADVGGSTVSFTGGLTSAGAGQVTTISPLSIAAGPFTGTLTIPDSLAAQWSVGPSSTSYGSFYSYDVTGVAAGGDVTFDVSSVSSVPLPSALLLLAPGLGLLGMRKRITG
jgi:hypothetical protein